MRENAKQNISEYGHFSRSADIFQNATTWRLQETSEEREICVKNNVFQSSHEIKTIH